MTRALALQTTTSTTMHPAVEIIQKQRKCHEFGLRSCWRSCCQIKRRLIDCLLINQHLRNYDFNKLQHIGRCGAVVVGVVNAWLFIKPTLLAWLA